MTQIVASSVGGIFEPKDKFEISKDKFVFQKTNLFFKRQILPFWGLICLLSFTNLYFETQICTLKTQITKIQKTN